MSNFRTWKEEPIGENTLPFNSGYFPEAMPNKIVMNTYFKNIRDSMIGKGQIKNGVMSDNDIGVLVFMIQSRFNDYDMIEENNTTIHNFFYDTFEENCVYYVQLLENYRKEYDYAQGNKRIVSRNDNINIEGHREINNDNNNKSTDYELPNKVIDDNYESTPSNINKTDTKEKSTNDYDNNTTHESQVVTEYKNEFLDLKNKYMNQIRDVLKEFASKFELCFQLVYDWR